MNDDDKYDGLHEARATFKHVQPMEPWPPMGMPRGNAAKPLSAKIFKSGNSLALRLPAALGMEAGMEMHIMPDNMGGYNLRRAPDATRKFNVDAIWGIGKDLGLKPIAPDDRVFDEVKRPWDDPAWPGWGDEHV